MTITSPIWPYRRSIDPSENGADCNRNISENTTRLSSTNCAWMVRSLTYLVDLNEQAQSRLECIIDQMKAADGVTEDSKAHDRMAWVQAMNSIRSRAEEVIPSELIYE